MKDILVSVIIPVYNGEQYLKQCLNSVLQQTHQNLEIIIINDKSPDNSQAIIDQFAKLDNRIISIVNKENKRAFVRHSGIEMAKGEFLLFLDQDDWLTKDAIQLLLHKIVAENADVVYGVTISVLDKYGIIKRNNGNSCLKEIQTQSISKPELFEKTYISYFGKNILRPSLLGNLYRKEVFERAHFISRPSALSSADLLLNLWVHPYLNKVCFVEDTVLYYRWGGMTNKASPNYLPNMKKVFAIKMDAIQEFKYSKAIPYVKIELANIFYSHFLMLLQHSKMGKEDLKNLISEELDTDWYVEAFNEMEEGRALLIKEKKIDEITEQIWSNYLKSKTNLKIKKFISKLLN
ncbi:MAG TPA: glycosyltransferase family 2 protein [Edaphocola sp.]|nr:glycosyltransferase family 2 protein [Edaphocola sp.]